MKEITAAPRLYQVISAATVIGATAIEAVAACATGEDRAATAEYDKRIVALLAQCLVEGVGITEADDVVTAAADDKVNSRTAIDPLIFCAITQGIVATTAKSKVIARAPHDLVLLIRAKDRIVAIAAFEIECLGGGDLTSGRAAAAVVDEGIACSAGS